MTDRDDREEIRNLIESWALWRDTGDFDQLATAWHADGRMVNVAGEFSATDFIEWARNAHGTGLDAVHAICGMAIEIAGNRAVARTRLMLSQRVMLEGVVCDIECWARFIDLLERRDGRWAIVLRHPAYDRDRIVSSDGRPVPALDPVRLARFPVGYRHLGYVHSLNGVPVRDDLPGSTGPAMEALQRRAKAWLQNG